MTACTGLPQDSSQNKDSVLDKTNVSEKDIKSYSDEDIQQKLLSMTLDEKIYSLFIVSPEQLLGKALPAGQDYLTEVNDELVSCMKKKPVSGVILFAGNLKNPPQVKNFTQPFYSRGFFVAIDEEGGVVSRIANNPAFEVPVYSSFSECTDPYSMYKTISAYLKEYGFNLDFAPVADVSVDGGGIIGTRAYSGNAELVSKAVSQAVNAFIDNRILCSLKHFPGHGAVTADSHLGAVVLNKSKEELNECEFLPFISGIKAGAPFVMLGHITVPELSGELPASLSPQIISILRNELSFEGVIITDSFRMHAITDLYDSKESVLRAIKAGVDIVLIPESLDDAYSSIKTAIEKGDLTEAELNAKVRRIITLKYSYGIY